MKNRATTLNLIRTNRRSVFGIAAVRRISVLVCLLSFLVPCAGEAAIQFRAATKHVSETMPLTASKPAGTTDGDLLIAFVIHDTGSACPCTPPAGQGWTAFSLPGSESGFTSRAWYKQVDAADAPRTDYTFTFTAGDNSAILYLAAFYEDSGIGTWILQDGTGWAFNAAANSLSNGGVTAVDNSLFVVAYGNDDNEVVTTEPPIGPTKIDEDAALGDALAAYYEMVDAIDGSVSYSITWGGSADELSAMAGIFRWSGCPGGVVTTTTDTGATSLRTCIDFANINPGTTISFNIPGPGNRSSGGDSWWAISPTSPLPTITVASTVIDGTTQTTNQGDTNSIGPEIELDGTSAGGGVHGLVIGGDGDGSTIRGLMINRFSANGLQVQSGANNLTIAGNWIGSDGSGAPAPGNGNNGINMLGGSATIGGTGAGDPNVINNNGNEGINLAGGGATGNAILGNIIGLEYDGTTGSGNGDVGIAILAGASGNTIGGLTAASRNIISMNFEGMEINTANNVVIGNYIGTDSGGTLDRGNRSDDGIEINGGGNNNTIGGTAVGAGNLIAFNQNHGVNITAGTGNTILSNGIHSNNLLGIDLGNNGVTANDAGDGDSGANDLLNFPVITSALDSGPAIDVIFGLDVPAGDYRVEFFNNPSGADPSTYGEGENFADALTITHGGTGLESFPHSLAGSAGDIITATATEESAGPSYGSTSEFSLAFTAIAASCAGGIVDNTADSGNRSLRECILIANANPGTTIGFSIAGVGNRSAGANNWFAISPLTPLPGITAAGTVIDGTTQTTNRGDSNSLGPEIEIDGVGSGATTNGLVIDVSADGSEIRGLAIGNFEVNGILLQGGNNVIAGNYVGLSADGTTVAANNPTGGLQLGGVRVESASNTIGGTTAADRNVISGNGFAGIDLVGAGATGNMVYGNYIGVDATGTAGRANTQEGIDLDLSGGNIIGGPLPGQRNIVSGNGSDGIEIDGGDSNVVQGNYIGTDFSGTLLIPNDRDGIDINENGGDGSTNTLIGGTGANEGNLIRGNMFYGVSIRGAPVIDNTVLGNQIYGNVLLDIDVNDDGITVNDPLDPDAGPNDILNYPAILAVTEVTGTITVDFILDVPAGDYRIEFFTNPSGAHSTGNGGGEIFADATTITHGGTGLEFFGHSFAGSAGDIITATATEELAGPSYASTSEFSTAVTTILGAPFTSSRWPLDETAGVTAADIDNGNDGIYRNGVLLNQAGACPITATAVHFDGVNQYVEVPHIPGYRLDEGTVSLWANVDVLTAAQQGLFSKDSTDLDTGGHLTINLEPAGEVRTRLQSTTASMTVTTTTQVVPGTWFHVAFSWGPGGMALYLDGAAPITDPYTGGLGTTSGGPGNYEPIAFGASTMTSGDLTVIATALHYAGYMDDVRIYNRALTQPEIVALANCTAGTVSISGTVFEDVNYGGSVGRDLATANADAGPFTLERDNVTVELYDSSGTYLSNTTTAVDGSYSFAALLPDVYTVRVVNSTVTSTRIGSDGSELAIQTFRADGDGEAVGEGANKVGGEQPIDEDASANSGAQTLVDLQSPVGQFTQSITTVDASGGDVSNVDFGFNFSTIVNTEGADQGSLRQFILNANLLTDNASLTQSGLTPAAETSVFMVPGVGDALGRPADSRQNFGGNSGGEFTIQAAAALPTVSDTVILDATTQAGFGGLPLMELDGTLTSPGDEGFLTAGSGHTIRGFVINRFDDDGIQLGGGGGNTIVGNYIGTDAAGTVALPNGDDGIDVDSAGNVIGGAAPADRNLISGNANRGTELSAGSADSTIVQGNYIGTDITGLLPLGNGADGVRVNTGIAGNLIGGSAAGVANVIAHNGGVGVLVVAGALNGNSILGNAIHSNTLLGIDLNNDGVTPNDAGDPDVGPNDLLNYPVITSALGSPGTVTGYFDLDVPAGDYRVEFFSNPSGADPSGNGEGEAFAGAVTITHTGSGIESFGHSFPGSVGDVITSTATEEFAGPTYGASSEFSAAVTVVDSCPGGIITTNLDSGVIGSLRSCIIWANGNPGADTLTVPAGTYNLSVNGTDEDAAATGDLDITDDITIDGDAVSATIIDANSIDRVIDILGASAAISNLTIRGGDSTGTAGGISIDAAGSLTATNVTISGNVANSDGGGIATTGGAVALTNVTISGNTANRGGGLDCAGPCTLTNVTVTANTAPANGDGVRQRTGSGSITFLNTIVANNNSGGAPECDGNPVLLISNGYNISSDASCDFTSAGDQENTDPLLGPLLDNGGPTFTHEPLVGSPAIEGGTNAGCPATDQRGFPRPVGATCDVGAYESGGAPLSLTKTAFWPDGTPIPSAAIIPSGVEFKYLLYINNKGVAQSDVTVRDVLDPAFQYQVGTIQVDNSVAECFAAACTPLEEQVIFLGVDGAAFLSDAPDGDVASYTGASFSVDAGNGNVANFQLDINASAVWAILFSAKMP